MSKVKMSCEAAESIEARFMTIECSRSVHSIVLRMARVNCKKHNLRRRECE